MHEALTAARHTGSPEVAPVVNNGRRVRFVNEPSDLRTDLYGRELGPWGFPRIVYAQHPSDPVVWWNNKLIWTQPDWLRERAGRGRLAGRGVHALRHLHPDPRRPARRRDRARRARAHLP